MAHVDLLFSRPAVYIGVVYNYLPLMVLPLYAALERIDWSLVEAARISATRRCARSAG